jgi:hypothetical protein
MNEKEKDKTQEELLMLFPVVIDDIKTLKRQQWTITYYGLLLLAAIIGFYGLLRSPYNHASCLEKGLLLAAAIVVFVVCTGYLIEHQYRLTQYRKRLEKIRNEFTERTKEIVDVREDYTSFGYFFGIVIPFILFLLAGVFFVGWILYR